MSPISALPHATAFAEPFGILMFRDSLRNARGTSQTNTAELFLFLFYFDALESKEYLLV